MKIGKRLLAGLLAMALALTTMPIDNIKADVVQSCDYRYEENTDGSVTITKYIGSGGEVVVPSEIGGKPVAKIAKGAFWDCSSMTSLEIPASVTTMEYYKNTGVVVVDEMRLNIFSGCDNLESIKVAEGNEYYDSRGKCNAIIATKRNLLLAGCKNTKIPASVAIIDDVAFRGCTGLTSVEIPEGVTEVRAGAFIECSSLTSIIIPKSLTKISYAFKGIFEDCSSLESIKVAEGNAVYDSREGCNALIETESNTLLAGCKNTKIPTSVTGIGKRAFFGCSGLTGIEIPASVATVGGASFSGCSSLESIKVAEGNAVYDSREGCNALIETESNTLLAGCKNTKIPTSVTGIGKRAFFGCSGLTGIEIPTNVTFIDRYAFFDCSGLTGIKIPASVTSISASAFSGCSENLIIYGVSGSEAERYAASNGIMFKEVDMPSQGGDVPSQDGDVPSQGGNTPVVPKAEDISQAAITLEKTSYTYDGKPKTPSVTVSFGAKTLVPHTDYTVSYHNNTKVGTANVTVTGKGNYTGSKSVTFAIVKAPEQEQQGTSITCKKTLYHVAYGKKPFKINASSKSKLSYTSNKPKIATVGKSTGKVTIKGTGVATITVKAGNKSVKVAIKVSPKRPSVKSIQAAKGKKLAVKWAKDKMASGYQVQVSTAKNFKQNLKTKKVTKTSYTFTKLKTGKRYYVRIRSYKKTNKETLYGAWSKVKQSRKVKK